MTYKSSFSPGNFHPPGNFVTTGELPPHRETSTPPGNLQWDSSLLGCQNQFRDPLCCFFVSRAGVLGTQGPKLHMGPKLVPRLRPKTTNMNRVCQGMPVFQYSGYGGKTSSPLGNIRPHREITNPPGNFDPHRETISPPGEKRGLNKSTAWT